jgi:hypothetical protein
MKKRYPAKRNIRQTRESKGKELQTNRGRAPEPHGHPDYVDQSRLENWLEAESEVLEPEHTGGFWRSERVAHNN